MRNVLNVRMIFFLREMKRKFRNQIISRFLKFKKSGQSSLIWRQETDVYKKMNETEKIDEYIADSKI